MNEVLDEGLPLHPLKEQRDSVGDWRQIGIGIFGLADLLIKMGIRYGSPESIDLCDAIGLAMASTAIETSAKLAKINQPYPKYDPDAVENSPFLLKNSMEDTYDLVRQFGLRNSQLLTIAPTGTLSTMLGVSGGIEPIFANYYTRKTESLHGHDEYYKIYTPIVQRYMEEHNIKDDRDLPEFFVTAQTLNYKDRIDMQSIWQKHIDASISSTVNVPTEFTVEDTEDLYMYAWEKGLKGVTIFRDGCKRAGILTTGNDSEKQNSNEAKASSDKFSLPRGFIYSVSDDLISYKRTVVNGCGKFYLHLDFDEETGEPLETWIDLGDGGGCERNLAFISRLISLALRGGIPLEAIIDQAKSVKPCLAYTRRTAKKGDTSPGTSCPSALGIALGELNEKIKDRCFYDLCDSCEIEPKYNVVAFDKRPKIKQESSDKCPDCGADLVFEGGCNVCKSCGYSRCG